MTEASSPSRRTAACGCGQLTATVRGEPSEVYLCSCRDCQRASGSSFTYAAVYPEAAVTVSGEHRLWRHQGESGRWLESGFCPDCGVKVIFRLQVVPGHVGVAVGCFADPHFARPAKVYWASRRHDWLALPEDIELLDRQ